MYILRGKDWEGQEKFVEVKVLGYVGTFNKPFCSDEHISKYKKEIRNIVKRQYGCCCG
jgi:hypothetical protein